MNIQFPTIETPRLRLKGLYPETISYIMNNLTKEEIKTELGHQSDADYEAELYKYTNGFSTYNRSFLLFLLIEKKTGTIIGRCGIHNWNKDHRRAEVGYVIQSDVYKRKGFMTEALESVIDYGFNTINLHRIEAIVGVNNIPSLRLMSKYHFRQEGIMRAHHLGADGFEDDIFFSLLKNEYIY